MCQKTERSVNPAATPPAQLIRALDGIAYSTVALAVVIAHPMLGRTPLGDLANLHLLPLLALAVSTFAVPTELLPGSDKWRANVWRLRLAVTLTFGLAPFVSWWLRAPDNAYLIAAGALALFAGVWYLLELATMVHELCAHCHEPRLTLESRVARVLVLYFVLIPTVAVHVSFTSALVFYRGTVLADLLRTWLFVPALVRLFMVLSVLNLAWVVWRSPSPARNSGTDRQAKQASDTSPIAHTGKE